jgi:hypothetical protein
VKNVSSCILFFFSHGFLFFPIVRCLILFYIDFRGLLKHWMLRSSVGLQEKRGISVLCYQHYNMCVFFFWILYDHIQHNTYVENNLWITFTKWVFPYPLLISFIPKKKKAYPLSRASILNRFFFGYCNLRIVVLFNI